MTKADEVQFCQEKPNDMSNCAYWLSCCLLLLYYLRTEPNLFIATGDHQEALSDLINEIVVYIVRDVERRLDRILEPGLVEYEALPGFEDIVFEGDWKGSKLVQKFGLRARPVSVMALFGSTSPLAISSPALSPTKSTATSLPAFLPSPTSNQLSPKHITGLLDATLFILQLYKV